MAVAAVAGDGGSRSPRNGCRFLSRLRWLEAQGAKPAGYALSAVVAECREHVRAGMREGRRARIEGGARRVHFAFLVQQVALVNGRSVPSCRSTAYWSAMQRHSARAFGASMRRRLRQPPRARRCHTSTTSRGHGQNAPPLNNCRRVVMRNLPIDRVCSAREYAWTGTCWLASLKR